MNGARPGSSSKISMGDENTDKQKQSEKDKTSGEDTKDEG